MSVQSVYVVLADLGHRHGVQVRTAGSPARYEIRTGTTTTTRTASAAESSATCRAPWGTRRASRPPQDHGFELLSAEVVYRGHLPSQQAAAAADLEA
ncbi:hypothetical protein QJS66_19895 [Kocuria rhizophila]|nr:hypothetical protein QJS66_19895 [Kocuria rhizophila]